MTMTTLKMLAAPLHQHDEQKAQKSGEKSIDRVSEETFISQNGHPNLKHFPGDLVYAKWRENHLPSLMSMSDRQSTTLAKLANQPKRHHFW